MEFVDPMQIISAGAVGGLWGWAGLAGAALMTSAAILALIYMWGVMFRNQGLIADTKQELYEVLVTGIMIVFIFMGIGAMSSLSIGSFLPGLVPLDVDPSENIYNVTAAYYMQVDKDMTGWLELNYVLNMYVDQMASVTPYARPLGVGLVASPMAGIAAPLKQLFSNMTVALSIAFIINYAQYAVYIFSLQGFLNYYLPLGMFLRAFTPTRRIGGTLIGVGLTFLFVFPALTCMTYAIFYNPTGSLVSFRSMAANYLSDPDFQGRFTSFMDPTGVTATGSSSQEAMGTGILDLITGAVGGLGTMIQNMVGTTFLALLIFPVSIVAWAFVIGFILPAFNIMVLTQAAKVLSKSFGDEVDISSLTRMI
ncbi:MAG: hypothetical protein PHF60_02160 [Candidatus ainarchaeum sp.]|nr:hypothetical protein [Candidatus ainarchaeum sp.]